MVSLKQIKDIASIVEIHKQYNGVNTLKKTFFATIVTDISEGMKESIDRWNFGLVLKRFIFF